MEKHISNVKFIWQGNYNNMKSNQIKIGNVNELKALKTFFVKNKTVHSKTVNGPIRHMHLLLCLIATLLMS